MYQAESAWENKRNLIGNLKIGLVLDETKFNKYLQM